MSRFAQARDPGDLQVTTAQPPTLTGSPGDLIAHFTYDALGRLIRIQRPLYVDGPTEEIYFHTRRCFYDGVRRVVELVATYEVIDPQTYTGSGVPIEIEVKDEGAITIVLEQRVDREYIHTPGGYTDEYICQIDRFGGVLYVLQDVNYNVVGLVDDEGLLLRQYTYDPYGQLIFAEVFGNHEDSRIGHQGLFFERLDAPPTANPFVPLGHGFFENRNRAYAPALGRFMQRDPNASGLPVLAAAAVQGRAVAAELGSLDLDAIYSDGMNLHACLGGNPSNRRDPMALLFGGAVDFIVPGPGDMLRGMLQGMVSAYSMNLLWTIEWAMDWSLPSEMNPWATDEWVEFAALQGVYDSFSIEIGPYELGNPLDPFVHGPMAGRGGGRKPKNVDSEGRPVHGDLKAHHNWIVAHYNHWKKIPGVTGLAINKAMRGPDGKILRGPNGETVRPDLHFWRGGKLYVREFTNTHPVDTRQGDIERILKNNKIPPTPHRFSFRNFNTGGKGINDP